MEACESLIRESLITGVQDRDMCLRILDLLTWLTFELSQAHNCLPPVSDHKFTVKSSPNGGVDIDFRCTTIHAPKSLSVRHPLIQMVLFANHFHDYVFSCPKSMAPKSITDMVERRQSSSASSVVYEAGWVPAKLQRERSEAVFYPLETANRNEDPSLPVLFHKSTNNVTSTAVSSTQRRDIFVQESEASISVTEWLHSVLAAATSLYQHLSLNNPTDERSDKQQCSDWRPATNSSDETKRVPDQARKLTDQGSEHHSAPNSCVAERDTMEEAKRSGEWFVATGTAHHATWNRNLISNLERLENDGLYVLAADGTPMPVCGRGDVVTDDVVLPDVYYVPGLCTNLVSVGQLAGLDYSTSFSRSSCVFSSAAGTVAGTAHARGDGLYQVDFLRVPLACHETIYI